MGRNLTSLPISASFQYLLQKSGSEVNDGLGADVDYLNISASYAYTASVADSALTADFATSASVATSATLALSASHAVSSDTATSASYASTASYAENASTPTLQQVTTAGNTTTDGVTIDNTITTRRVDVGGSGINGVVNVYSTTDNEIFRATATGVQIGGLSQNYDLLHYGNTTQNGNQNITGAVTASAGFKGNLDGNATTATSASYATTASYAENGGVTSIIAGTNVTISPIGGTGDVTINATGGGTVNTGSFYTSSSIADATITFTQGDGSTESVTVNNVANATSASLATNAKNAYVNVSAANVDYHVTFNTINAGYKELLQETQAAQFTYNPSNNKLTVENIAATTLSGSLSGNATSATSASHAVSSDTAISASHALIANVASFAATSTSASHAVNADTATSSSYALTASYVEGVGVTPTLQQVTDAGNITTNQLVLTGSGVYVSSSGSPSSNFNFGTEYNGNLGIILNSTALYDRLALYGTGKEASIFMLGNDNKISTTTNSDIEIGDLHGTGKIITKNISASGYISASEFIGDGSKLENLPAGDPFPYTGSAVITGSLSVTGSVEIDGNLTSGNPNNSATGTDTVVIGGNNNSASPARSFVVGGESNSVSAGLSNGIVGGTGNSVTNRKSVIVGGQNSTISHERSVILGGSGLSSTKNDEAVVPNLLVKGNVVQDVNTISIASNTGSLDASLGSLYQITLQNGVDTLLEMENQVAGQTLQLKIINNATSAGTISFDNQFKFEGGTAFTATAATNAVDILTMTTFDGSSVQCVGAKNFS